MLVRDIFVDGSCSSEKWCGMCAALAGEAAPGPSTSVPYQGGTESRERPTLPLLVEIPLWDFPLEAVSEACL